MPIPDFQSIMLPFLKFAGDELVHHINEAVDHLGEYFQVSDEEQAKLLPSGQQPVFYNRVGWARTYLKKADLLDSPQRGYFQITERGKDVLSSAPERIDMKFLRQFPEYLEFRERSKDESAVEEDDEEIEDLTPEEALEDVYQRIHQELQSELINSVVKSSPGFFEKLVIELLVNMGYGGSRREAAKAVGRSGDGGIDGIIDEDRLGLDTIYIQAKKWSQENPVGRPEIQKFVGALQGRRARKGIFITTTRFTSEAEQYVSNIDTKVVLIDGERLSSLMIDYNVGVSAQTTYEVKTIDSDYFGQSSNTT